jgi:uncharacterized membrane protein YfcA
MEYIGFAASFAMGIVLGLMGGGGSILTVPILVYVFSISPLIATGYSLFIVGTTALIGSSIYLRRREVDFQVGLFFALPSITGVNISRGFIIPKIPDVVLELNHFILTKEVLVMSVFAVLMLAASYSMIQKKSEKRPIQIHFILRTLLISILGLIVGLIAGFVGAGGGFLIIPALVFMAGLSMRTAVGTSLMIIAVQSLFGFIGDISRGVIVDWNLLGWVALFAITGIIVGSRVSHKVKEQNLKLAFGWFVLVMGIGILLEQLRHLSL